MKAIALLFTIGLLFVHSAEAQTSKKDNVSRYQKIQKLDTASIEKGNHLELAKLLDISEFINYYIEFGKVNTSKEYGRTTIVELYKDAAFTYFGRKYTYGLIEFIKTPERDLNEINYTELDGNVLRKKFLERNCTTI